MVTSLTIFQISEAMDVCTKRGLRYFGEKRMHEQTDVPQISLELLSAISRSDFPTERSYKQWQKRQVSCNNCFYLELAIG